MGKKRKRKEEGEKRKRQRKEEKERRRQRKREDGFFMAAIAVTKNFRTEASSEAHRRRLCQR